jgi:hypothetical protein
MSTGYPQNIQRTTGPRPDQDSIAVVRKRALHLEWRKGEAGQTACKPGSVPSRGKRRSFLWTAHCWTVLATYPDPRSAGNGTACPRRKTPGADMRTPIWSCSRRGLPCRPGHPVRGGLLPHPFTLTGRSKAARRFAFCGAIPGVTPGGRYPPPCHRGARTFLPDAEAPARSPGRLARSQGVPGKRGGQPAARRKRAISRARVSPSATPSMRSWRQWRWNARTMAAVAAS